MLKIGTVKWRGKCSKHPGFDPVMDGPGAIRGNCLKCSQLCEIYEYHQKALRLMRSFQPILGKRKPTEPALDDLQQELFAEA
jgi:hypothetical protein